MAAYLFAHFIGEEKDGEQIYFSLSRDGLHWQDLNEGKPVLYSKTGTGGVRDPFLVRHPETGRIYLIATDLRMETGREWKDARENGSRSIIVWETEDMVHWSLERSCEVGIREAGDVWAPEAVYDREKEAFLVFFASWVRREGEAEGRHRIYAAYTKDFAKYSETFLYMERDRDVIDTTILEQNGRFYRVSKDETSARLLLEASDSLTGEFKQIESPAQDMLEGVEGPEGYLLPDGTWCLIADRFRLGQGYLPMLTKDLASGDFRILSSEEYDFGETKKRHGGILQITEEEYERLLFSFGGFGRRNPVIDGLYADPDVYYEKGVFYIYPTTDGFPSWSGSEFYVFTSPDGMHFEKAAKILDVSSKQVPWASGSAWAPCIVRKGETYYFYFCAKNKAGQSCIGAATALSPTGPFTAMEAPLITMEMMAQRGIRMSQTIDPSIFCEEENYYLLFGNGEAAIVKLTEDMLHIEEETLRNLKGLKDFREVVSVLKRGGRYHFTWSCDDTGSEDYHVNYGVSESLYGPVTFLYTILEKNSQKGILGTGHHCIMKMPHDDSYLIGYHRFATPTERYPEGKGWHREVCLAPLFFDENGFMLPVQ